MMHTLSQLLKAFQEEDIPVIPLKGAHLAEIVYHDPALRPMSDLDLLFRRPDLPRVVDKLTAMGYQPIKEFWIEYQCQVSHELPPFFKADSPPVEVHWTLILPTLSFAVDLDGLWERARPCSIGEARSWSLSPEDLILHLCIHASTQHLLRNGLRMTYDIAASLEHYQNEIDWDAFLQRAQQWKADRASYLMLFLAQRLFGSPMPGDFLSRLKPMDFDPKIVEVAKNLIFMRPQYLSTFSPQLATLLQTKGLLARTWLITKRIFLPPGEMALIYPVLPGSPKVILYYLVRLKDVFLKHFCPGLKLVRGETKTVDSARLALSRSEQENWLVKALT